MTRKHFKQLAHEINLQRAALSDSSNGYYAVKTLAYGIARNVCKPMNPNFDEKRFIEACGFVYEEGL